MTRSHPSSYRLGQHTLELSEDERIAIVNDAVVVELEREEVYHLLLVLQELFMQHDQPADKETDHAPD